MVNSIKGKVQVATNGILPAQGTGEYLDLINTKNTPASLKAEADLLNKEIIMTSQFNNSQDKLAYEILEQTKKDSQAIIDSITRNELRKETSVREKAQYMIDKAKAEFDIKDAETEQNRISAMTNLTEFLAHIGALNTDGNAKIGIETLNQKYQAQRQALRTNFELGVREIQMDMNDKINELESNLEEDILKINMDLSKSEREVKIDSLKLKNDTNKAILKAQQEYSQSIRQWKDKQEAKAEKYTNDWTSAYLTVAGGDMFKSLPKEFQTEWLKNNPISKDGTKTTQEDLAKTFSEWQGSSEKAVTLTPSKKTEAISWLTNNSAPTWVIEGVKNGDENAILTTMRLMEENK